MIRLICLILMMAMSTTAYGFSIGGELSTAFEVSKETGGETEKLWENYLRLDDTKLISPYLDMSFYGKYTRNDGESYTDIYSAYLQYSTFQSAIELKLGRFAYVGNRFLTLDGGQITVRTDYYFGATAFAGSPKYFDTDARHINATFRDTGDRFYGGKIFLNGVRHTTGYLSISKEEQDDDTLLELAGLGLGRSFSLGDAAFNTGGKLEYDTQQNDIYKGALRLCMTYGKLTLIGDGTRYNVKEGSAYEDELVINNFLSGQEDRLSYTVQYEVTGNITPYQSTVYSKMEVANGEMVKGEIYKLGANLNYFKTVGVTGSIEGYYYTSEISDANGGSLVLDWNITRKLRLNFESEILRLKNSTANETVYSVYLATEYDPVKSLTFSIFGENNKETRYLPENRYGIKAVYGF